MASSELLTWVNSALIKLLGIDAGAIEDISSYLVAITNQEELISFVKELFSGSSDNADLNGPQKEFIRELVNRWQRVLVPENITVYKKESNDNINKPISNLNSLATQIHKSSANPFDMTKIKDNLEKSSSKKSKKKANYVSLYGKDGEVRENAVMLPGRNSCECQAQKHRLINNCLGCGRVVCEQEGSGPCLFCGELVCTRDEKEVLARNSIKSEKLRNKLIRIPGGSALTKANNENITSALDKARAYKERLLNYDRTCAQRTRVIDDESDYYSTDTNIWLSEKERKYLQKKQAEIRELRHGSRLNKKFTLDFAGRQVVEDHYEHYDPTEDADVMAANFGGDLSESFEGKQFSLEDESVGGFPGLVNPNVKGNVPTYINTNEESSDEIIENVWNKPNNRLQDKQLLEMSDPGMCLSMHQPWASLLVRGIKRDEGRSWYSSHRGRLWIAAAAKQPSKEEIFTVEEHHKRHWQQINEASNMPELPTEYPVGCLLGCVNVKEVLSQEEYDRAYPLGESGAAFVFVCENPFELAVKFPVKGKHKIWKLDPKLHKSAKNALVF